MTLVNLDKAYQRRPKCMQKPMLLMTSRLVRSSCSWLHVKFQTRMPRLLEGTENCARAVVIWRAGLRAQKEAPCSCYLVSAKISYADSTLGQSKQYDFPAFSTLTIPMAHRLHGKRRSWRHLRERADNCLTTSFQKRFRVRMFFSKHRLGSRQTVKVNENSRNSLQLILFVGHVLIPYLSSENMKFDGRRCLAASAKRRRVPVAIVLPYNYPRLVSILSLLGSGETGDWSAHQPAGRIASIISRSVSTSTPQKERKGHETGGPREG